MRPRLRSIPWPRFTLLQLLASIAIVALACASIVVPNGLVAAAWHLAVFAMLSFAIAAAVYQIGATRAFWVGFALFGWLVVESRRFHVFDFSDASTIAVEKVFLLGLEDVYQQQAVGAAEARMRLEPMSLRSANPTVRGQAAQELGNIKVQLEKCIYSFLAIIVALLGGVLGKWLYATRTSTDGTANHKPCQQSSQVEKSVLT